MEPLSPTSLSPEEYLNSLILGTPEGDQVIEIIQQHYNRPLEEIEGVHGGLLHYAVLHRHHSLVESLLKLAVPRSRPNENLLTPLHLASTNGDLATMMSLLYLSPSPSHASPPSSPTHTDLKPLVLSPYIELNAKTRAGHTPLTLATINERKNAVYLLTLSGADVSVSDAHGYSLLHHSARLSTLWFTSFYLSSALPPPLPGSSSSPPVNRPSTSGGLTPLHVAAMEGNLDVFQLLLRSGGDVDAVSSDGLTPFQSATGDVRLFLERKFASSKSKYLQKPPWSSGRSFSIFCRQVILYLIFMTALWHGGWLVALSLATVLMATWYRYGDWWGEDERTTFYFGWVWCFFATNFWVVWFGSDNSVAVGTRSQFSTFYLVYTVFIFFLLLYVYFSKYDAGLIMKSSSAQSLEDIHQIVQAGEAANIKICPTCQLLRPVRSKHDKHTDVCIPRFDHYCFMTNFAVGAENHVWFMICLANTIFNSILYLCLCYVELPPGSGIFSLLSQSALGTFSILQTVAMTQQQLVTFLYQVLLNSSHFRRIAHRFGSQIRLFTLVISNDLFEFSLLTLQIYFISRNLTTNEFFNYRRYYPSGVNPFDLGTRKANALQWAFASPPHYLYSAMSLSQFREMVGLGPMKEEV